MSIEFLSHINFQPVKEAFSRMELEARLKRANVMNESVASTPLSDRPHDPAIAEPISPATPVEKTLLKMAAKARIQKACRQSNSFESILNTIDRDEQLQQIQQQLGFAYTHQLIGITLAAASQAISGS